MSKRISTDKLYDKLNALGVAPSGNDTLGKYGNRFWILTNDADYADRAAAAIRRAGGRAASVVTTFDDGTIYGHVMGFVDDLFDKPDYRQPPLMQVDGWT